MAWSNEEKTGRAALDANFDSRRKAAMDANAKKIDAAIAARRAAVAVKPSAEQAAKARRDAITKRAAPSGFQRLLSALGYKLD